MAHKINGIITSFKYVGKLANVVLVGNYHLIPFTNTYEKSYLASTLLPYNEFTKEIRKTLKELSFKGKCAYIETDYFGGPGKQITEAWHNGEQIIGPLISFDGINDPKIPSGANITEDAINEILKTIGVYRHDEKDEFDSIRLGWYRSNTEIFEEFEQKNLIVNQMQLS